MSATTLVAVTGSTVPYIYDLPHLLSLPPGFEGRFRYDPRWVDPQVRRALEVKKSMKAFGGAKVILTFHSREFRRLLPVREGTVVSMERLGPLYYLRFTVGEFVAVSREVLDSEDPDATPWEQFGVDLLNASGWNLAKGLPEGKYLFLAPTGAEAWSRFQHRQTFGTLPPDETTTPLTRLWDKVVAVSRVPFARNQVLGTIDQQWARVVSLLRDEPHLSGIPMFHLHGLVDRAGRLRKPVRMKNSFTRTGLTSSGYRLVDGDQYRLRLIQWRGRSAGPERRYRAACEVDETTVHLEGKSDLVLGKYDVLEYSVRAIMPGYSELLLRADAVAPENELPRRPRRPEKAEWPQVYAARVPIQVRRRWRRVIGGLALGTSGAALLLAPSIAAAWFPTLQPHLTDAVRTVLQFFGTLLLFVAYGSFLSGYAKFAGDTQKLISPPAGGGAK